MPASDLVTRLRNDWQPGYANPTLQNEAADEIERLCNEAIVLKRDYAAVVKSKKIEVVQSPAPSQCKEMYEALKTCVELLELWRHWTPSHCTAFNDFESLPEIEKARAALAKFEEMPLPDQWQPINDKAKTGDRIIIYSPKFGNPVLDTDVTEFPGGKPPLPIIRWGLKWAYEARWSAEMNAWISNNDFHFLVEPESWMPLPQPPQQRDKE